MLIFAFTFLAGFAASADEPELRVFHFESAGVDCYRMEFSGRKPVEEVVIGASWDGHPISDDMKIDVVSKPSGWKAKIESKARHGYQYVVLHAPEPASYKDVPRGNLGKVCIRFAGELKEAPELPYKYLLRDQPNYIISIVTPGSSGNSDDLEKLAGDGAAEKLDKVRDAKKKLRKLKDLGDVF